MTEEDPVRLLSMPMDGVPDVIASDLDLQTGCALLAAGFGPIALDAERASGHRYGQRAFLVQLRGDGVGTMLIDPVSIADMTPLANVLNSREWILHSATQDLPCLSDLGLTPGQIFDTELAARLVGLPRIGLASLTEDLLDVGLAKGYGGADWSRRPLPDDWLIYAALDVELLAELRDDLSERLRRAGRTEWARQEFQWLRTWQPRARIDPWRRTPGISRIKTPRGLAVMERLWTAREAAAEDIDRPPRRVLRDDALLAAARTLPSSRTALADTPEFKGQRRNLDRWWLAVSEALALSESCLPAMVVHDGPPPTRAWERRRPLAAVRLKAVRTALCEHAQELGVAPEVLISPEPIRLLIWDTPDDHVPDHEQIVAALASAGCRQWQIDESAALISNSLLTARSSA